MIIVAILIVMLFLIFINHTERMTSHNDLSIFNGVWVYETPNKSVMDFISIQTDERYMEIRNKLITEPVFGPNVPPALNRKINTTTEYPLFRVIPITETRVQITSTIHTYAMNPILISYVETTRGPALIIDKKYYFSTESMF